MQNSQYILLKYVFWKAGRTTSITSTPAKWSVCTAVCLTLNNILPKQIQTPPTEYTFSKSKYKFLQIKYIFPQIKYKSPQMNTNS